MGKYLLNAPDEDLVAWKQAAKDEGLSLAAWIRRHLTEVLWEKQNKNLDGLDYTYKITDELTKPNAVLTEVTADDIPGPLHDLVSAEDPPPAVVATPEPEQAPTDRGSASALTSRVNVSQVMRETSRTFKPDPKPQKMKKKR